MTKVDEFWKDHIVGNSTLIETKEDLIEKIKFRDNLYPEYSDLMGLDENMDGKSIIDYGVGPAFDLCSLILKNKFAEAVGIDISEKALAYARHNLDLLGGNYVMLLKLDDSFSYGVPNFDDPFDIIIASGVVHHATDSYKVLKYLRALMGPKSELRIMVYNVESIFNHLVVCAEGDGIFQHYVDGGDCPVARNYYPESFIYVLNSLGLNTKFMGGYTDPRERDNLEERIDKALSNKDLEDDHKYFLESVELIDGLPYYKGKLCGLGGVYRATIE